MATRLLAKHGENGRSSISGTHQNGANPTTRYGGLHLGIVEKTCELKRKRGLVG